MSLELALLVVTAVLAVVAVAAALVAVRAARRPPASVEGPAVEVPRPSTELAIPEPQPVARVVEGRVIVTPTTRQVVDATMNRPLVRVSILSHGLAHALRPESRDRIMALMKREFQSRRRQRKRAAKRAARVEHPSPAPIDNATITTEAWLGELPPVRQKAIDS